MKMFGGCTIVAAMIASCVGSGAAGADAGARCCRGS